MKIIKTFLRLITVICFGFLISCSQEERLASENSSNIPNNNRSTGKSSNELLAENIFTKLYIDLVYVEGHKPTTSAINNFKTFLQDRLHKSGGIQVVQTAIPATGKEVYTINDIVELENNQRTTFNTKEEIAVFAFFADKEFSENEDNSSILGVAYKNTSLVIFEETLKNASNNSSLSLSALETTVLKHEFSHLLGLVNLGSEMQINHQDTAHGKHCDQEDCLMFWQVETSQGMLGLFGNNASPDLDEQCLADLRANGGK